MIIHILNNMLHSIDLIVKAGFIFRKCFLASDLFLNLVKPFVKVVQILSSLAEFFLDSLLQLEQNNLNSKKLDFFFQCYSPFPFINIVFASIKFDSCNFSGNLIHKPNSKYTNNLTK